MKRNLNRTCCIGYLVFIMLFNFSATGDEGGSNVEWNGEFTYEMFQLVKHKGRSGTDIILGLDERADDKQWFHRINGEAGLSVNPNENLLFKIGLRVGVGSGLSECKLVYSKEHFSLTGGRFEYSYNPDVKNLGEYLIWSACYPGYVFSGRDWAAHTGLMIETDIVPGLKQNFLLVTDMEQIPYYDFSLVYIASYPIGNILDFGIGAMAHHLIPVRPNMTNIDNNNIQTGVDDTGGAIYENVDYSHRGTKLSGRLSLNIKGIFNSPDIFGKEDLKIYGEWAWLGVKNYKVFYDKPIERMPIMFGINLPAFNLLDYCSVEAEWYSSPHDNTPPYEPTDVYPHNAPLGSQDDWKWSVSLKRSITDNLSIHARAARDHLRLQDASGSVERFERIIAKDHWYWSTKITFSF